MNTFHYQAPKLDTRFASAIGDGIANAGTAAVEYDKRKKRHSIDLANNALSGQKQALAQSEYDQGVADKNAALGAFANIAAKEYPEMTKAAGYDPQNPNIFTQNKLGNYAKAKMEFDKSRPKPVIQETDHGYMQHDPSSNTWKDTGMKPYVKPMDGLTSNEKEFGRLYGFGTPEYKNAMNNVAAKKQMIVTAGPNGAEQYVLPSTGGNNGTPMVIANKKSSAQPKENEYKSVNAVIQTFGDLDYLDDNYKDDYVGAFDGKINELLRRAGVPESNWTGNKGYSLFQQALGNLNNKERNELMGAVLTPQEIAAYNKQTITEDDDNQAFKQKLARKKEIVNNAFERYYNQIADTYGEESANKMFETSKRLDAYKQSRAQRRGGGTKPKITQQEASSYMEELKRAGIIK